MGFHKYRLLKSLIHCWLPFLSFTAQSSQNMAEEEDDKGKIVKLLKTQIQDDDEDDDSDVDDDCYEIDPVEFNSKISFNLQSSDDDDEVALVAAKGPVALRDFPHPRHLCANFPFTKTPHESFCSKCFCYVCDIAAPCLQWTGTSRHCNVSKKPLEN